SIFDRIRTEFELELAKKLALIRELDVTGPLGISFCEGKLTPEEGEGNSSKEHCTGDPVPVISARFKLNLEGDQYGIYQTHLKSSPTPPFNLASRRYFQAIRDGDTWRLDSSRLQRWLPGETYSPLIQALDGQRYYLQRIESYVDSTLETAISVPLFKSELPEETGGTNESVAAGEPGPLTGPDKLVGARVAVARFRSLEDVVMPPGFGFAVFENRSGKVLFHNDYRRSLRENFYRATDDDSDLKAAVIAGVKMGLDLDYKGESVHAVMGPLADTPWTLVVYYRKPLVDIINFHFGVTASILSAVFILMFLIGSGILALTVPRLIQVWKAAEEPPPSFVPEWVYPLDGKAAQYVDLTGMNLGLLFLYTGITYHLDITHSWPWLVLSTAAIYGLWHRHLCPEFYSRQLPRWMQPWVTWVPYGFALAVVLAYGDMLIAHGGLYYLLGSALVAVGLYLLMRFNEARKRRRLASQPVSQQQAGLRARDLVNYRRATCVFVLMLSVSPTILLYNENFDVHEKLWVEYNNWYNSDQLRDRSAGYEAYAQRTNQASDLGDFMLKTWQGVYLPRTEVFSLQAREEDSNRATPGTGDRELKPRVSRWPELRRKYWLPERFDQEFTIFMLVAPDGIADTLDDCEARTDIEGRSYWQCANQPQVDKQVSLMKNLVKALPSFSTTGSLLESFTERTRIEHAMQEPDSVGVATTQ
ncbi:MAG: hypothetical protein V2I66_12770, partial [Halieaceae bacterium]|nr:hypothetical protein [Halieaceae bacterium]